MRRETFSQSVDIKVSFVSVLSVHVIRFLTTIMHISMFIFLPGFFVAAGITVVIAQGAYKLFQLKADSF